MTREEEKKEAARKYATHDVDTDETDFYGNYVKKEDFVLPEYNAFLAGSNWSDENPKSHWISVKEDLPCNHEELLRNDILTKQVLVVSKDKEDNSIRVCTNYMLKVGIFSQPTNEYRWSGKFYNEVTHWMPLPEPPKE